MGISPRSKYEIASRFRIDKDPDVLSVKILLLLRVGVESRSSGYMKAAGTDRNTM